MIRTRILICAMGTVAAICLATCAPTEPLPVNGGKSSETEDSSNGKPVVKLPAPVPDRKAEVKLPVPVPDLLRSRVEAAIDNVQRRDLLVTNSFWTVFHGILGLGPSITLLDEKGKRINAVDYICNGGELIGLEFQPTKNGIDVVTGKIETKSQGHQDQFIAEMAQWDMPKDRKFSVNGKDYTYMDFVRHTKARASVKANQELSWAIVILGQYLGTDITWTNDFGEKLNFEDLVRYELDQPIEPVTVLGRRVEGACGGSHRLFGLTWAQYMHLRKGGQKVGVWQEVAEKNEKYQKLARELRNPDGSFSTSFFERLADIPEAQPRIYATGHILEWLALSLPDSELHKAWVEDAVNALAKMILQNEDKEIESGALYHATHGLLIYYARAWNEHKSGIPEPFVPLPPRETLGKAR